MAPGGDVLVDGKYRLLRQLGEGGMGVVWEAEHVFLKKHVACKLLRAEIAALPDIANRFVAEAQAASAIDHPNVVKVSDFGRAPDGTLYLVMELLTGRSLADELSAVGSVGVSRALHIAIETLAGLEAAHAGGVVHRDLKPENIFLAGDRRVLVVDFGVARRIGNDIRLTVDGTLVGTPLYMAPEQARGDADVDARADLHAVGVVLFEMLTGRTPYVGDNFAVIAHRIIDGRPPSLAEVWPEAPAVLTALVGKSIAPDRALRFQSAGEMKAALIRLRTDLGAVAAVVSDDDVQAFRGPALTTIPARKSPNLDRSTPSAVLGDDVGDDQPIELDRGAGGRPANEKRPALVQQSPSLYSPASPQSPASADAPIELVRRPEPPSLPLPASSRPLPWVGIGIVLLCLVGAGSVVWLRPSLVGMQVSTVNVTFSGVPAGARLFLDNKPWTAPYHAERDNRTHTVRVEYRGKSHLIQLVPDVDQQLDGGF